jgi:hypothetical protein
VTVCVNIFKVTRVTVCGFMRVIFARCNRSPEPLVHRVHRSRETLHRKRNEDWVDLLEAGAAGDAFALDAAAGIFGAVDRRNVKHGQSVTGAR